MFCAGGGNLGQVSKQNFSPYSESILLRTFSPGSPVTLTSLCDMTPPSNSPRKQSSLLSHPHKTKTTKQNAWLF